jgi:branched-chain amino acid transport system permease protein
VVGLYSFVGLSGVVSFGHAAFVALGCYLTALVTLPPELKSTLLPDLPGVLADTTMGTVPALILAAAVGGVVGYALAIPLMRLSGLPAGIATLAVLAISQVTLDHWDAVTRGNKTFIGAPVDTTRWGAFAWAVVVIVGVFAFQRSRWGLRLQASREDATAATSVAINVHTHRRIAFAVSAAVCAVAGGLYGHFLGVFSPDNFYIDLTFLLLVMLVMGGATSLAGAVLGTIVVMAIQEVLQRLEAGVSIGSITLDLPSGVPALALAVILLVVIVWRPAGIMGGREMSWPGRWTRAG